MKRRRKCPFGQRRECKKLLEETTLLYTEIDLFLLPSSIFQVFKFDIKEYKRKIYKKNLPNIRKIKPRIRSLRKNIK